jgi:lipopolysaccharide export system protein LptA
VNKTAWLAIVTPLVLILVLAAPAAAQVRSGEPGVARGPIAISADRLETDETAGLVRFIGAVVARQGGLTLTCDRMNVHYTLSPSGPEAAGSSPLASGRREIDRVESFGQVKMVDGHRLALGDHGLYLAREAPRRLILTGHARLRQGRDSLTGHRIIYYLDEKRSVAESAPQGRVTTVVHGGTDAPSP